MVKVPIDRDVLDKLLAGDTSEVEKSLLREILAANTALEERRAKDRERKRVSRRVSKRVQNPATSADIPRTFRGQSTDTSPSPIPPITPLTTPPPPNLQTDARARDGAVLPKGRPQVAFEIATEIAFICGWPDIEKWPRNWCGKPHQLPTVERWLAKGYERELIIRVCRKEIAQKHDGPPWSLSFFEGPIASAHAHSIAKLPLFQVLDGKMGDSNATGYEPTGSNIVNAGLRRVAEFRELARRRRESKPDGDRGEGGAGERAGDAPVRVLPKG